MVKIINHINIDGLLQDVRRSNGKTVEVGFFDAKNATKAAYNEYGTDKIPSRPFMRTAIKKNSKSWGDKCGKAMKAMIQGMPSEQVAELLAMQMKADFSKSLVSGGWTPNAPATVRAKGSSRPLVDTGEMRADINYRIKK